MNSYNKKIFISIVVPVYNSHTYICQCINSLLDQNISDEDYEIICIDDGSTDGSEIIIDEYAKKYTNVIAIHKINGGVSSARNIGIKNAKGEYIWFVDADDFISPNILKELKTIATTNNSDRITVESYSFSDELNLMYVKDLINKGKLKPNMPYKEVMATRTIYKREYLNKNNILFLENVHYGEDGVFNYQTLIHNPQTDNSEILAYFYRIHNASVTNAPKEERTKKSLEGTKLVFDVLVQDYNNKVCPTQTRRMLLYWMYVVLKSYSSLDRNYFCKNFVWEYKLLNIPLFDFELRYLNNSFHYLSKSHNYKKLTKLSKKHLKKNKHKKELQAKKKLIFGYIQHPKRFLNKIIKN